MQNPCARHSKEPVRYARAKNFFLLRVRYGCAEKIFSW